MSEMTGMDASHISDRLKNLEATLQDRAPMYPSAEALQLIYGATGKSLDPAEERAALDRSRRRAIEMRTAERRGQLIHCDRVAALWAGQVQIARGRLLSLPSRLAPEVVRAGDVVTAERLMREAIREILAELAATSADEVAAATALVEVGVELR